MVAVITKYVSDFKRANKANKGVCKLIRKKSDLLGMEFTSVLVVGRYPGNSQHFKELLIETKARIKNDNTKEEPS